MPLILIEGGQQEPRRWAEDLRDPRLYVRQRAARHLAQHPEDARGAVGALAAALADRDVRVRHAAALALDQVGAPARDVLIVTLGHCRTVAREWAAVLLGRLGPSARDAEAALEERTLDPEWEVRVAAQEALRRVLEPPAQSSSKDARP